METIPEKTFMIICTYVRICVCNEYLRFQLHIAAYQNAFACYMALLTNDASINLKDIYNRTPLMLACYKGHLKMVGKYSI